MIDPEKPRVPKCGATLYSRDGRVFEFYEALDDNRWLLYTTYEGRDYDGEYVPYASGQLVVGNPNEYSETEPKPGVHPSVANLETQLKELRDKLIEARREWSDFERDEKARRLRIAAHDRLDNLDVYLQGRIKYVLVIGSALTLKDFVKSPGDLRPIVLVASNASSFKWQMTQYADGSGSPKDILFFETYEEAHAALLAQIEADFEAWRNGDTTNLGRALTACQGYNLDIPADFIEHQNQEKLAALAAQITKTRKYLAEMTEKYMERVVE